MQSQTLQSEVPGLRKRLLRMDWHISGGSYDQLPESKEDAQHPVHVLGFEPVDITVTWLSMLLAMQCPGQVPTDPEASWICLLAPGGGYSCRL